MFANLANKRKLDEATSAKDDVAPVYLLEDLWQILQSAGPETATGFVEYINRRLATKSPVVKQKALRVVKFLCAKGSSDFKRNISKHASAIRELQHFRGEPDPFKGDVPNQKVRDMAKEAVEAMFAPTEAPSYTSSQPAAFNRRIQGFGSSQAADGFSVAPTSSNKPTGMMGFGNSRYESQSSQLGGISSSSSSRYGRGGYEAPGETSGRGEGGFSGMIQRVNSGALSPKAIMDSITAKGNEFLQGKRGPGILNNDDQTGYSSDEADRGYEKPPVNGSSGGFSSLSTQRAENGGGSGEGREETRLVNQVCTPGGLRAQPTREDLAIFVESAGGLRGDLIAERLAEKMASTSWQASLRALCALEAVIQHGSTASCGEIAVFFQSSPEALEGAVGSPQASVRQRATRVLQLLGVSDPTPTSSAPQAASSSTPDLLSGLDDEPEAPTAQQPAASAPASQHDLLGDLMDPPKADDGMFSGLAVPSFASGTAVHAHEHQTAAPDMFQGLTTGTAATSTGLEAGDFFSRPSGVQPQPAAPAGNALEDLMSGEFSAPAQAGSTSRSHDPFSGSTAPAGGDTASAELSDIFAGLSTSSASFQSQPPRQPTPQQLAAQRAPSLGKDPLSALSGLSQEHAPPMGQGVSAQRGAPPSISTPYQGMGVQQQAFLGMQGAAGGFPPAQLNPQQVQYLRQMQYMQYMQMQAMQARAMAAGQQMAGFPGQHPGFGSLQQPSHQQTHTGLAQPHPGNNSSLGGAIALESLSGPSSGQSLGANRSSSLGITQQSDFDFVGEHVKTLRGKK